MILISLARSLEPPMLSKTDPMSPRSVNQVIHQCLELNGHCLSVEGLLCFESEETTLRHWPKAEGDRWILIDPDGPLFDFDEAVLRRWHGKRIVIHGIVDHVPRDPTFDGWSAGFGRFGLWDLRIRARRIDLLKTWKRHHPELSS